MQADTQCWEKWESRKICAAQVCIGCGRCIKEKDNWLRMNKGMACKRQGNQEHHCASVWWSCNTSI